MSTETDEENSYEEEFDENLELRKSKTSIPFVITEEICGTIVIVTGLICLTVLVLHWT